jgi:membrane-bound lytic murein transglycosylase
LIIKENKIMQRFTVNTIEVVQRLRVKTTVAFATILLMVGVGALAYAQKSTQETFSSAEKASHALFVAVQSNDQQALVKILGGRKELVSSNDEIEDKIEREQFVGKYQEMHRLVREPDGATVLYVGAENWPFPVPLVLKAGAWYFDSDSGAQEIQFRQVGEDEATAIETCHALVRATARAIATSAQTTNAGSDAGSENEHVSQYAQTLVSTREAMASSEKESGAFHGYYFRILSGPRKRRAGTKDKGPSAGRRSGDVFIAYPADYRSSGVMTFIITPDDVVYEKDLGPNTATLARKMTASALTSRWRPAE